jgi:hypothetical protein
MRARQLVEPARKDSSLIDEHTLVQYFLRTTPPRGLLRSSRRVPWTPQGLKRPHP